MDKDLESRIKALERQSAATVQQPTKAHALRQRLVFCAVIILVIAALAYGIAWRYSFEQRFLPASIVSSADFTVYEPSRDADYTAVRQSLQLSDGILTYQLAKGPRIITVSQQRLPDAPPALSGITGFKPLDLPLGNAIIGDSGTNAVLVIQTKTTLISLSAPKNTDNQELTSAASSLIATE